MLHVGSLTANRRETCLVYEIHRPCQIHTTTASVWHPVKSLLLNGILQMKHNLLASVSCSFEPNFISTHISTHTNDWLKHQLNFMQYVSQIKKKTNKTRKKNKPKKNPRKTYLGLNVHKNIKIFFIFQQTYCKTKYLCIHNSKYHLSSTIISINFFSIYHLNYC